ncbi:MAG: hypothetical protein WC043_05310 [Pseudobdellovibrionaceae bacterium]
MRKPNKTYRFLGGSRSRFGRAFRSAQAPIRSLRLSFGRDTVARDAAESLPMDACRRGFQLVMATLRSWGSHYRGPRLSTLFRSLNRPRIEEPALTELEPN